jgi:RHS repeat-associated protein
MRMSSASLNGPEAPQSAITFSEFPVGSGPTTYNMTYGAEGISFCTLDSGGNYLNVCAANYSPPADWFGDLPGITAAPNDTDGPILAAATNSSEDMYSVGGMFTYHAPDQQYPSSRYGDGTYVLAAAVSFDLVCLAGNSGSVFVNWTVRNSTGGYGLIGEGFYCSGVPSVQTITRTFPYGLEFFKLFTDAHVAKAGQPRFGIDNVSYLIAPHGPALSMEGGGPNPSAYPTTCYGGDPVNCATGTLTETVPIASVPGRGVPLYLSRSYSSATAGTDGPFGYGWTDSYALSVATDSSGTVTITQENGSTVAFTPGSSGTYQAAAGVLGALLAQPGGGYVFTRKPAQVRFFFTASGQLVKEMDRNDQTTTLGYDGSGHLTTVTDPGGRQLQLTYTGNHITAVAAPMGRETDFGYDTGGNLITVTDPLHRATHYTYDASHLLETMTDPRGGKTTNAYDGTGRVVRQADPAGLVTTWSYGGDATSDNGGITTLTDGHGNVEKLTYSDLELLSVTKGFGTPAAATTQYGYDARVYGRDRIVLPTGTIDNYYDADGNLTATDDRLGLLTSYTYDGLDDRTSTSLPGGESISAAYDAHGNLISTTDAMMATTHYAHDDLNHPGDVTSVSDPDGRISDYTYDAYGNRLSITTTPNAGSTSVTSWVYDLDGEAVCQTSPNAHAAGASCPPAGGPRVANTTTTVFDDDGEPTSVTNPLGHTTATDYDNDGNVKKVTDPKGNITTTTYDADNRVTDRTYGANGSSPSTTHTDFDIAAGTVPCTAAITGAVYCTAKTDPNQHTTVDYYSARDQLLAEVRPDIRTTSYGYDLDGNRVSLTSPNGAITSYGYDRDDRLTSVTYSDGSTPNVSYGYDDDSRRIRMVDGTGTTTYRYDLDSRLTGTTDGAGKSVGYGYDGAGDVTTITYPNAQQVSRVYDGARRLKSVSDWLGHTTSYHYDRDDNLTKTDQPNGDAVASSYDSTDQLSGTSLTDAAGNPMAGIGYTRDLNGMLSHETDSGALTGNIDYGYTEQNELSTAGTTNYQYDRAGNPTAFAGTAQSYNPTNALTSSCAAPSTTSYTQDADGSRTSQSPAGAGVAGTYTYDQADRLIASRTATRTGGFLTTLTPTRIADTSSGSGLPYAGQALAAGATLNVQVAGRGGVPTSGVNAVIVRLTEKDSSAATTLTSYPTGIARPGTATLITNTALLVATRPRTTEVTLSTGSNGQISVYNSAGTTNIGIDVVGYYTSTAGLTYNPTAVTRVIDTRSGSGNTYDGQTLTPSGHLTAAIAGTNNIPADATAAVVAITALNVSSSGGLDIYPAGAAAPTSPTMYIQSGQASTEQITVALGSNPAGALALLNTTSGNADVTLDVVGYYTAPAGAGFNPVSPARLADTRANSGQGYSGQHLAAGATLTIQASGHGGIPNGATAAVLTITVPTASTSPTYLTAYSADATRPTRTSVVYDNELTTLLSTNSDVPATELTVPLSQAGALTIYNSAGTTDVTIDILGYYAGGVPTSATYAYNGDGLRADATTNASSGHFVWDSDPTVPHLLDDGVRYYIYGPDSQPAEQISNAAAAYYIHDQLGSTRALTDDTGALVATYSYGPFGALTSHTGTADTLLRWSAQVEDGGGLYYLRARYYDPSTAQFLTRDPIEQLTEEPYQYANNDPLDLTDPTGLCSLGCAFGWVGVGVAAVGIGVVTFGVGDVALAGIAGIGGAADAVGVGSVTVGAAFDVTAVAAGATAAGFDCSDHPGSPQCLLDVASVGLGGAGAVTDGLGRPVMGIALNSGSIVAGTTALLLTEPQAC